MNEPLLRIRDLQVKFGPVRAVDGVSLDIHPGETLGLVGESGCGKTTLGRAILRLVRPVGGEVRYKGQLLTDDMRPFRRHMQMVFQDPYASLNPRMSVSSIIAEPMHVLGLTRSEEVRPRVERLMTLVGLSPRFIGRYPHEFSGGQRQRIGIARALAAEPEFIVADEPISALDVSIQAQILNLLERLQSELRLTCLFISHDLRAVHHIADRVAVMYAGEIVELAPADELYRRPYMPYTRALISAIPSANPQTQSGHAPAVLVGDVPSQVRPPNGCRLHPRCPYAIPECSEVKPALQQITPGHWAACIRIGPEQPDIDRAVV
jgi:oligopeptide transport system ATP-binding protein